MHLPHVCKTIPSWWIFKQSFQLSASVCWNQSFHSIKMNWSGKRSMEYSIWPTVSGWSQVSEYASQAKGQLFQKSMIHRYTSSNEDRTIYKAESPWHPNFGDNRVVMREASTDKGLPNLSIPKSMKNCQTWCGMHCGSNTETGKEEGPWSLLTSQCSLIDELWTVSQRN